MKALPIEQYDLQGNLLATYNGLREVERLTGIKAGTCADHITSGKPLAGCLWKGDCHRQTKAQRNARDKRRAEIRLREAQSIKPYEDKENLLSLLHEPYRAILGHRMQKAIENGGSPRMEFAKWYTHQYEIDIASDTIVAALGYTTPCDE